jgi:hypothetical protein
VLETVAAQNDGRLINFGTQDITVSMADFKIVDVDRNFPPRDRPRGMLVSAFAAPAETRGRG